MVITYGGQHDWHTDVHQVPATLRKRDALPTHLSMMLVLSDK